MEFTLILVAKDTLRLDHLSRMERLLDEHHIRFSTKPVWLKPHKAAEVGIGDYLRPEQMNIMRDNFSKDNIDVFIVHTNARCKKIIFCDMEATIIQDEILDELAKHLNLTDKILNITKAAMAGEIDFDTALKDRVALLKGTDIETLRTIAKKIIPSDGAETLIKTLRSNNIKCVLVSGGFTFFTSKIAAIMDFKTHHGNELIFEDNKLTGEVKLPILNRAAKADIIHHYCRELSLNLHDCAAVGDGANDADMLSISGLGIGYYPKPYLHDKVINQIHHTDLTSILYMMGFTWQDIQKANKHD